MRRVASQPSITGIFKSIKIKSGAPLSTMAKASCPFAASTISKSPIRRSRYTRMRRLSRLSSTTRIFFRAEILGRMRHAGVRDALDRLVHEALEIPMHLGATL